MNRTVIEFTGARELRLTQEPVPALKPGQLLLRTTRTLISTGTESIVYTRNFAPGTHFDEWVKYPFRPGYLHCGVVEGMGEGVEGWRVGDRAATRAGHASHVVVGAKDAIHVPPSVSDEEAAWMGLGKITQLGVRAAEHRLGDSVVLIGLGLLGQLVARYVALSGAREIIAIDPWPTRLEHLRLGIPVHRIAAPADTALAEVQRLCGGRRGADVVYDITGHHAVFPTALPLARDFGRLVLLGDTGKPQLQTLTPDIVTRGLHVVGVHDCHAPATDFEGRDRAWTASRIGELFLHYLARNQMEIKSLITHRFRPEEAPQAYDLLQTRRETVMGVVFCWN